MSVIALKLLQLKASIIDALVLYNFNVAIILLIP